MCFLDLHPADLGSFLGEVSCTFIPEGSGPCVPLLGLGMNSFP